MISTTSTNQPKNYKNIIVNKPWRFEFMPSEFKKVSIWLLFMKKNYSTSFHCHGFKDTPLILLKGKIIPKLPVLESKKIIHKKLEQFENKKKYFFFNLRCNLKKKYDILLDQENILLEKIAKKHSDKKTS